MKRAFLLAVSVLLLFGQVYGQFGKLTKALNKAKTFADLRVSDEDEQALGQAITGGPGSGREVQPTKSPLDLHHPGFRQHQRLCGARGIHPHYAGCPGRNEERSRTRWRAGT